MNFVSGCLKINIALTAWRASCLPYNISVVLVGWKPTLQYFRPLWWARMPTIRRLVYQSFSGCLNDFYAITPD
ncbi:MAG: hypothetical protein IJ187_07065 [Neisseriaceae bacterium]|nr:hypothetical protein [Neisseriaceae bacterium]